MADTILALCGAVVVVYAIYSLVRFLVDQSCEYKKTCQNFTKDFVCLQAPSQYHQSCYKKKKSLLIQELLELNSEKLRVIEYLKPIDARIIAILDKLNKEYKK